MKPTDRFISYNTTERKIITQTVEETVLLRDRIVDVLSKTSDIKETGPSVFYLGSHLARKVRESKNKTGRLSACVSEWHHFFAELSGLLVKNDKSLKNKKLREHFCEIVNDLSKIARDITEGSK